ncbi:hypothetical protein [Pseudomonas sp. PS01299]|uniref:hypothetical protein n=1 Tax=Pseudomonas sp. PS01299 TaxID=2991435 RepID=UPI00249AC494|nr:hypothetical protein [Pseudomonas sp. PS01299]
MASGGFSLQQISQRLTPYIPSIFTHKRLWFVYTAGPYGAPFDGSIWLLIAYAKAKLDNLPVALSNWKEKSAMVEELEQFQQDLRESVRQMKA